MQKFVVALMVCAFVSPAFAADASAPMDHMKMEKHHRLHKPHKQKHEMHQKDMKHMDAKHAASGAQ
jgi:hypothetical protein